MFWKNVKTNLIMCLQLLDEKKLKEVDNLFEDFETPEAASKV